MWSHYGDHCKGFCLQFSTLADPFQKIKKVRYTPDMPILDIVPIPCGEDSDPVADLYCTKAVGWAYEHEWRAIHSQRIGILPKHSQASTSAQTCHSLRLRSSR